MELNADFSQPALVHSDEVDWLASPMPGIDRRMLDRIGGEVARATTIVRYAAGSRFSAHIHSGGEEFIVLEGVFQDEHGDYPAGTYVRNPPTTGHTPGSAPGCTIFVKLWQFDPEDRNQFRKDMAAELGPAADGLAQAVLHRDARETVRYLVADAQTAVTLDEAGGTELLMMDGMLDVAGERLRKGSWLRLPEGEPLRGVAGADGAKIWVKTGHMPFAVPPAG